MKNKKTRLSAIALAAADARVADSGHRRLSDNRRSDIPAAS